MMGSGMRVPERTPICLAEADWPSPGGLEVFSHSPSLSFVCVHSTVYLCAFRHAHTQNCQAEPSLGAISDNREKV